jgi:hypothetical protein
MPFPPVTFDITIRRRHAGSVGNNYMDEVVSLEIGAVQTFIDQEFVNWSCTIPGLPPKIGGFPPWPLIN